MSTDISTVEEVAFGAARTAAEVASDPIGSARKQVKGLKRKGSPTARKVNRQLTEQINAATAPAMDVADAVKEFAHKAEKVAADLVPERIAIRGLHVVKVQAKRQDQVGDIAKRALKMFNGSFKTIARVATRLEKASELPAVAPRKATAPRRSARRATARRSAAA
jgi:hypothetical protein